MLSWTWGSPHSEWDISVLLGSQGSQTSNGERNALFYTISTPLWMVLTLFPRGPWWFPPTGKPYREHILYKAQACCFFPLETFGRVSRGEARVAVMETLCSLILNGISVNTTNVRVFWNSPPLQEDQSLEWDVASYREPAFSRKEWRGLRGYEHTERLFPSPLCSSLLSF